MVLYPLETFECAIWSLPHAPDLQYMVGDRVRSAIGGRTDCKDQSFTNGDDKQPFTTII